MVKVRKNYFFVNFADKSFAVERIWTFSGRNFCGFGKNTKSFSANTFFP